MNSNNFVSAQSRRDNAITPHRRELRRIIKSFLPLLCCWVMIACGSGKKEQTAHNQLKSADETIETRPTQDILYDEVWKDEEIADMVNKDYVMAKLNGKTGIINSVTGEVVVPLIYDEFNYWRVYSEWLLVSKEGKWGCIDFTGATVFSFVYDALQFKDLDANILGVCIDGKWGLAEAGDNMIIPAQYDAIGFFKGDYGRGNQYIGDGLAPVKKNGKWGFINRKNELIVPYIYDSVLQDAFGVVHEGEVADVERNGAAFWIDKKGKERPH